MTPIRRIRFLDPIAAIPALMFVTGCAVGPDFKKPTAPNISAYTAAPLSTTASVANIAGGEAQRFV